MQASDTSTKQLIPTTIESFWGTIPPVWNQIEGNIRDIADQQYGIKVEQFHILRHIRQGLASVSELAQVKQISRSAISQAVDVLVERGLVSRRQNVHDRRNIPLELTTEGDQLLDVIWEKNRSWMQQQMATLSALELGTLLQGMEILTRTFTTPTNPNL